MTLYVVLVLIVYTWLVAASRAERAADLHARGVYLPTARQLRAWRRDRLQSKGRNHVR